MREVAARPCRTLRLLAPCGSPLSDAALPRSLPLDSRQWLHVPSSVVFAQVGAGGYNRAVELDAAWPVGLQRERKEASVAISTADFRNGMCIEYNGKLCTIVEFQHVKPGKGGAFVRTKLKDIKTGRVVDYTFNSGTKFDTVRLETKKMQYLYNDGANYNFMDNTTYEQLEIPAETVGDAAKWLKENDEASLLYAGEELISIEPQMFVELEVTHTEPGFKGDTATNTTKPATLETGIELQVPTFIEIGDVLQIDTRDGRVIKRV